jgi:hypothetical protein
MESSLLLGTLLPRRRLALKSRRLSGAEGIVEGVIHRRKVSASHILLDEQLGKQDQSAISKDVVNMPLQILLARHKAYRQANLLILKR